VRPLRWVGLLADDMDQVFSSTAIARIEFSARCFRSFSFRISISLRARVPDIRVERRIGNGIRPGSVAWMLRPAKSRTAPGPYLLAQRTREVGSAWPLAPSAPDVFRTVAGQGLDLAAVGIASASLLHSQ
jgi:hypothetical protein